MICSPPHSDKNIYRDSTSNESEENNLVTRIDHQRSGYRHGTDRAHLPFR